MIVVLGLYRGGSSCVAGVLHHLGVCMGHNLKSVPGYATYEDWSIRNACVECYREPDGTPMLGYAERVNRLRDWADARRAQCGCKMLGVKYPLLSMMGPEVEEAFGGGLTYVSVERDPAVAASSLRRWFGSHAESLTHRLHEARDKFLATREHVAVNYGQLVADPTTGVYRMVRSLPGVMPTTVQWTAAIQSVRRREAA